MIYSYVPFAVLPIYAAAERFDFQLIEAARDLGAKQWQSFLKVFLLPGSGGGSSPPSSWCSSRRSGPTSSPIWSAGRTAR